MSANLTKSRIKPPLGITEFIALFALMTSLTALSIDVMLPALPEIGLSLSVHDTKDIRLVITALVLGMVFGEIFFGPFSDSSGRKTAILVGIVIYCLGTVIAMAADSLWQLLLARTIQGIGVAGPKIASRALIRDQYSGDEMAKIMSLIMTVFIFVPMVAPILGQFILVIANWRSIFMTLFLLAVFVAIWFGLRQPETLPVEQRIPYSVPNIVRIVCRIARDFSVMAHTLAAGMIFGTLLTFYSMAPFLFQELYGMDGEFVFYFAFLAFGIGIASFVNSRLVLRCGTYFLSMMALGGLCLCSFLLLVTAYFQNGVPSFPLFMLFGFLMFFCIGMLFGNLNAMAMRSLGHVAGVIGFFVYS